MAVLAVLLLVSLRGYAGFSGWYPIEDGIIAFGESTLLEDINDQVKSAAAINACMVPMRVEYRSMRNWQRQYTAYLDTAGYIISSVQASVTIYNQALEVLREMYFVTRAMHENIKNNHGEGIVSTAMLNDIYLKTAVQFVKTFRTLQTVVKRGGQKNMLNGAERCEVLWQISFELDELKHDLHALAMQVRCNNLLDVWMQLTIPYGVYDHEHVASYCLDHLCRASVTVSDAIKDEKGKGL